MMKRALVTGGSGDLGHAIAAALAVAGHFVYVHANNNIARAQETVRRIVDEGGNAQAIHHTPDASRPLC